MASLVLNRLRVATALVVLSLAGASGACPIAAAEEAVLIPGASPFKEINPSYAGIAAGYPSIGVNFHDDDDPQVVGYSQNPLASDCAILEGVGKATLAVRAIDGKVVVIGESMGAMVAARLAAELADSSDPLPPDDMRVVLIASPEVGVARYFPVGTHIPVLNYRVSRVPASPYATSIVTGEYDGWADPPDRPWNLLALANAALGTSYVHGPPMWSVDPAVQHPENITVDGHVTTYLVPTKNLPLNQPLRDLGLPDAVVDAADRLVRPIIDAAYVRHDRPGDSRPYLDRGKLVRSPADAAVPGRPPSRGLADRGADAALRRIEPAKGTASAAAASARASAAHAAAAGGAVRGR